MYLTITRETSILTICCIIFSFLMIFDFLLPYEQMPDYLRYGIYYVSILTHAFISFFKLSFSQSVIKEKAFRFSLTGLLISHFYYPAIELSGYPMENYNQVLWINATGAGIIFLLRIIFLISLYRTPGTIWHRYLKISAWLSVTMTTIIILIPQILFMVRMNMDTDSTSQINNILNNILRNLHLIPILFMIRFFLNNGDNGIQQNEYRNEEILDLNE